MVATVVVEEAVRLSTALQAQTMRMTALELGLLVARLLQLSTLPWMLS
jgi:hypothetical protein